ncbi:magnesium/cobalt transporter CorA [Aliifodinibius sp. S!AR15-10]|uniref:magnesium/cobalt transporter CorA n=1 Tax=Aliifodinibius sp. S!AR15-10 TaxID=2950437 RepID=UPI0028590D40|nr:magnesium/cobalt transporter CorA [Aliifodinibius sp. S!AR15-10]MDR8390538.1 magnesium/cobalt transporter CorA [Aliifodinibius sp. S!AR15-10]
MFKNSRRLPILTKRRRKKPGSAPGTVEHIGEQRLDDIQLTIHDYDEDHLDEIHIEDVEESRPYLENPSKTWIKVCGLHDIEKLKSIWSYFDLHPLVQEDIVNTTQRPKAEAYENNMYFVVKMLSWSGEKQQIESEQVSLVLSNTYVLSFQETDREFFQPILDRLKFGNVRIRKNGVDYLMYALIDAIVDHYFSVLEQIGDRIEQLEEQLLDDPDQEVLHDIHALRRDLIFFRKSVWPLRDVLNATIRDETSFIDDNTKLFLRDVYDHMVQIIDNIENYRDMVLSMHDMYMSHVSNKMNEVMKVLTIIATIFIPLTFIAGIYGMNFDPAASPYNMPELQWYWGYPVAMASMAVIAIIMIFYFRRKGWF